MDRLLELELRRRKRQGHASPPPSRTHQSRYPANTLGPQEDVVEQRRGIHRTHVSIPARAPQTRNVLLENLLLLAVLAGSIWGLYALTVYLLTHS